MVQTSKDPVDVVRDGLRKVVPEPARRYIRRLVNGSPLPPESASLTLAPTDPAVPGAGGGPVPGIYETLYEQHAERHDDYTVVGEGIERFGRLELAILHKEGLQPTQTLVDLGCGIGRLAAQVVPWLEGGHYIGTDISQQILTRAAHRIAVVVPNPPCEVTWIKQSDNTFPIPDATVDMVCAFSVFTHTEHEDTYNILKDARRIVRLGGTFVLSCLPMDLDASRVIFVNSSKVDFNARWSDVRNVTTSVDLMEMIALMAGWKTKAWYRGDQKHFEVDGELNNFGQSVMVLEAH
jgi:ubiquinone/menaquinone biosynthesis C-methylase UbiE